MCFMKQEMWYFIPVLAEKHENNMPQHEILHISCSQHNLSIIKAYWKGCE